MSLHQRISNKHGSLNRNNFLMNSVTTLKHHDVYSKYASLPKCQIDVCWLFKIQFDRKICVRNWCLISRKISDQWCAGLDLKPRLLGYYVCLGHYFKAVKLPYLLLIRRFATSNTRSTFATKVLSMGTLVALLDGCERNFLINYPSRRFTPTLITSQSRT
jgi:hypothetical protein